MATINTDIYIVVGVAAVGVFGVVSSSPSS
jgi:hypothetical protein